MLKILGPYEVFIICLLIRILLYLPIGQKKNKEKQMTKRTIKPRIPPQVNLPPLGQTTQQIPTQQTVDLAPAVPTAPPVATVLQSQSTSPAETQQVSIQHVPAMEQHEEQVVDSTNVPDETETQEFGGTYFLLETPKTGHLELDLVSYRQKGVEKRFLNVKVKGKAKDNGEFVMNITNKSDFEAFRNFVSNLNWDD